MARRRMTEDQAAEARECLLALAGDLELVMRESGGRSAMVRVYADGAGRSMAACNLFLDTGSDHSGPLQATIEFREALP